MSVVNVRKAELQKRGINNFQEWNAMDNTEYIGRNINFYVKGTYNSKWRNPFSAQKYGRDKCIEMFEEYIRNDELMIDQLHELKNKELGCWCHPENCHGDVLLKLIDEFVK